MFAFLVFRSPNARNTPQLNMSLRRSLRIAQRNSPIVPIKLESLFDDVIPRKRKRRTSQADAEQSWENIPVKIEEDPNTLPLPSTHEYPMVEEVEEKVQLKRTRRNPYISEDNPHGFSPSVMQRLSRLNDTNRAMEEQKLLRAREMMAKSRSNPEVRRRELERHKEWNTVNKEKIVQAAREWYDKNRRNVEPEEKERMVRMKAEYLASKQVAKLQAAASPQLPSSPVTPQRPRLRPSAPLAPSPLSPTVSTNETPSPSISTPANVKKTRTRVNPWISAENPHGFTPATLKRLSQLDAVQREKEERSLLKSRESTARRRNNPEFRVKELAQKKVYNDKKKLEKLERETGDEDGAHQERNIHPLEVMRPTEIAQVLLDHDHEENHHEENEEAEMEVELMPIAVELVDLSADESPEHAQDKARGQLETLRAPRPTAEEMHFEDLASIETDASNSAVKTSASSHVLDNSDDDDDMVTLCPMKGLEHYTPSPSPIRKSSSETHIFRSLSIPDSYSISENDSVPKFSHRVELRLSRMTGEQRDAEIARLLKARERAKLYRLKKEMLSASIVDGNK